MVAGRMLVNSGDGSLGFVAGNAIVAFSADGLTRV
jgi:hypothetical protein